MRFGCPPRSVPRLLVALATAVCSLTSSARAETIWEYDFGTGTGTFTSGESTGFLPAPPTDGGTARVRIGSGGGQFALVNPVGGSLLQGNASTSTSVNKFSIYGFAGTGLFMLDASLTFSGATSGSWSLLAGDGSSYSNNSSFTTAEVFAGLRWDFGAEGGLTTSRLSSSGNWLTTNLPTLTQDMTYRLTIYGNNSPIPVAYDGLILAANAWDLWIDGSRASTGLAKAGLPDAVAIDSFMFNGINSGGNAATLTIDSLTYANHVVPEPGSLGLFGALLVRAAIAPARAFRPRRSGSPRRG
jgi:hypothetical protein